MKGLRIVFFLLAIIASIFILTIELSQHQRYSNLWVLPLITSVACLIPFYRTNNYIVDSISILVISVIMIRNCLSPVFFVLSNFEAEIDGGSQNYYNLSILLLSLETIFVFLIIFKWSKKLQKKSNYNKLSEKTYKSFEITSSYIPYLLLMGFVSLYCVLVSPSVLDKYAPIWLVEENNMMEVYETNIYDTIFSIFFGVFRLMFTVLIIYLVYKHFNKHGFMSNVLLLFIIFLPALITSENYGFVLISVVVTYLFINLTQKNIGKTLKLSIAVLSVIVFFTVLTIKGYENEGDKSLVSEISSFLQAYIPGLSNLTGVFRMSDIPKETTLFYDFYYMIPFRKTLFGIPGDFRSVIFFNNSNGVSSQIIPCIGQCYLYLGILGSFISAFPVWLSYWLSSKINIKLRTVDYIIIYACVYCALTPFLYNYTILGSWLFMSLLPAFIVMYSPLITKKR